MSDHFEGAQLSDGRHLIVLVPSHSQHDVRIQMLRGRAVIDEARLPYPEAGLGGGRILLSPTEQLAVLAYFSGQGEQAYEVYRLSDRITNVCRSPYQSGRGASYAFSPDERLLVRAIPLYYCEWETIEHEHALPDGQGNLILGLGHVHVHDLSTDHVSVTELRAILREGWQPPDPEYDPDLRPRFTSDQQLSLSLPWGELRAYLPLPTSLDIEVK